MCNWRAPQMIDEIKRTSRVLEMLLLIASSPERYTRQRLADTVRVA